MSDRFEYPEDVQMYLCETSEVAATVMAQVLLDLVMQHEGSKPFSIALSGGSTPKRFYELLSQEPFQEQIPWENVSFFFGDERSVAPEHSDSNFRMSFEALLQHIPSKHFRMEAESGNDKAYEAILKEQLVANEEGIPQFDLVLLGIGTDGHTASLFPGTKALQEQQRFVVMNEVPQLETSRMTITYPIIQSAHHVWVLATGENKRPIVKGALQPDSSEDVPSWPILRVNPTQGTLTWWLDHASAKDLME